MRPELAVVIPAWNERHNLELLLPALREVIDDLGVPAEIVLDLEDAVGLDVQHTKLRWLRPRHGRLVRASGARLPFRDRALDLVITSQVIEHVRDADRHLAEAARVLRTGGTLVVGTPDYGRRLWWVLEWIYGRVLPDAYAHEHITHYTRASLARAVTALGFDIEEVRYVGGCELILRATKRAA